MREDELKTHLEYLTGRRPRPESISVADVIARLDAHLEGEADVADRLRHYLEKRSYVKALEWLEDPSTPHRQ